MATRLSQADGVTSSAAAAVLTRRSMSSETVAFRKYRLRILVILIVALHGNTASQRSSGNSPFE